MTSKILKISLIIPAYNEEMNILKSLDQALKVLRGSGIPFEIIAVNDNCQDKTQQFIEAKQKEAPEIKLVNRDQPRGFGRAIRAGIEAAEGDVIIPFMADLSDDCRDIIKYYKKIEEGYDCVYGSRFLNGSRVTNYPPIKLVINRVVNRLLQLLFLTAHNDLTNAFKAFRTYVIRDIMPLQACHFNITIELSLSALIRGYRIASIPVRWNGREWGSSKLKLKEMGRRYLATLLKIWFEKLLILDDLIQDRPKDTLRFHRPPDFGPDCKTNNLKSGGHQSSNSSKNSFSAPHSG